MFSSAVHRASEGLLCTQEQAICDAMAAEEDVLQQQVLVVEKEAEETRQRLAEESHKLQEERLNLIIKL